MNFSSSQELFSKKDYAEILLLALGMVLLTGGEQVGLLGTDLAPQSGYASSQRIYEMLAAQTGLAGGGRPVTARSQVVLMSDFYFPLRELASFCERLAARNVKGLLVQIFDPAEQTLPYTGRVRFQDAEDTAAEPVVIPHVEAIREEYERKFSAHQKSLAALAENLGWRFEKFTTATKPEAALTQLYNDLSVKI
jgi:uncharacterized protein (DUF58 family)